MIQVLQRFDALLQYAARMRRPCRIGELAKHLGVSQPTCSNIVRSMVDLGYLEPSPQGGYIVGPSPSVIAGSCGYKQHIVSAAEEPLEELVHEINENCLIAVHSGDRRIVLAHRYCNRSVQSYIAEVTEHLPLNATGVILLAEMGEKELTEFCRRYRFFSSIFDDAEDWESFCGHLDEVRRSGMVSHFSGPESDRIFALAIPVFCHGCCEASLGCSLPACRFSEEYVEKIRRSMEGTARVIQKRLERSGDG